MIDVVIESLERGKYLGVQDGKPRLVTSQFIWQMDADARSIAQLNFCSAISTPDGQYLWAAEKQADISLALSESDSSLEFAPTGLPTEQGIAVGIGNGVAFLAAGADGRAFLSGNAMSWVFIPV